MMEKYLLIELGQSEPITLRFKVRSTPLAELWLDRMRQRQAWPMDHPDRFYNFNSREQEQARGKEIIQQCMETINAFEPVIQRQFEYTQDCLNYLHNIFEQYHGLLDQQTSDLWQRAPSEVKKALAELNIAVHRCEAAMDIPKPRFVCTWFGMPKTHQLDQELQGIYGEWRIRFGTVYLNYCEIGKTVEDLANDNDKYIGDDAFKPFGHYSADFNVQFYDRDLSDQYKSIQHYIDQHQDFFVAHDIKSVYNIKAQPLRFPVADLVYSGSQNDLLTQISQRQWVNRVEIVE